MLRKCKKTKKCRRDKDGDILRTSNTISWIIIRKKPKRGETFFNFLKGFKEWFLFFIFEIASEIVKQSFSTQRNGDDDRTHSRDYPCWCVLQRYSFTTLPHRIDQMRFSRQQEVRFTDTTLIKHTLSLCFPLFFSPSFLSLSLFYLSVCFLFPWMAAVTLDEFECIKFN